MKLTRTEKTIKKYENIGWINSVIFCNTNEYERNIQMNSLAFKNFTSGKIVVPSFDNYNIYILSK